jgi:CubicO group peptidase (beta-lactamase class C family)
MKPSYLFSQITLFLLLSLSVFSCAGQSTPTSNSQTEVNQLDKLISTYTEYGKFNGTVLVAKEGKIMYQKGLGLANMEWKVPNQPNTKFRIGSITKQFTALLIMQLVAEKKLDLHTPISTYLPDYPKKNGNQITLHHLLTHTSGIPNSYSSPTPKINKPNMVIPIITLLNNWLVNFQACP